MTAGARRWADVLEDHLAFGRPAAELATPALLVDLDVLERNIATMAAFFTGRPARLRPHAKTHRAPAIARLQVAAGAHGVTAPKVGVAEAMIDGGIDDVYVANQVVHRLVIARLADLARRARVEVHPSHCCAAANLHDRDFGVRNGEVEAVWAVTARGRLQ